ncbi:MAG: ATP-binding cassette domain-containing protein [Actinomycetota bacterium]|nr:ATP-binding cassette domain-containing protein [Actinomycetota bacterium]
MTVEIEVDSASKHFGQVTALDDFSAVVKSGEVTCVLGDNGAGKSTLIKILSGVFPPDEGEVRLDGQRVRFTSPRDALGQGIATVYQDLAMIPLMSVWRNFFLGTEPTRGTVPFRRLDTSGAKQTVVDEMAKMGIHIRDPEQPVGTLSGGERQSLAIARAVYFGARALILDEPTAALGVKQAGVVLRYIVMAKKRGLAVIFITHNPNHAYPVGDHFVILRRGRVEGDFRKEELPLDRLMQMMAGGEDLSNLVEELEQLAAETGEADLATAAHSLKGEVEELRRPGSTDHGKGTDA